jgi:hypothetical protein
LAQLLRLNGAAHITLAANKGIKTQIARDLGVADDYYELDREDPSGQWKEIKDKHPRGFDIVVSTRPVTVSMSVPHALGTERSRPLVRPRSPPMQLTTCDEGAP